MFCIQHKFTLLVFSFWCNVSEVCCVCNTAFSDKSSKYFKGLLGSWSVNSRLSIANCAAYLVIAFTN